MKRTRRRRRRKNTQNQKPPKANPQPDTWSQACGVFTK